MDPKEISSKIRVVKSQTTYNDVDARTKLEYHNWNVENVILEFMGGSKIKEPEMSNNQKIFKAFRELY
jgi:hypothetical protein